MSDADKLLVARYIIWMFMNRLKAFGNWDEGCFYYNKVSASELEEPMQLAEKFLK